MGAQRRRVARSDPATEHDAGALRACGASATNPRETSRIPGPPKNPLTMAKLFDCFTCDSCRGRAIIYRSDGFVVMIDDDGAHTRKVREAVRQAYSAASRQPHGQHAFPVGRAFAESLGYPSDLLARLPGTSVDAFSGVSNVSIFAEIPAGARILDLGCGAGLDSLIAAVRAGSDAMVVGVDFSAEMLERARTAAREAGLKNAVLCRADAEALPIKDGSIDVALINGIFNLNPSRDAIFLRACARASQRRLRLRRGAHLARVASTGDPRQRGKLVRVNRWGEGGRRLPGRISRCRIQRGSYSANGAKRPHQESEGACRGSGGPKVSGADHPSRAKPDTARLAIRRRRAPG